MTTPSQRARIAALISSAALAVASQEAAAVPVLIFWYGTQDFVVLDGSALDSDPTAGVVTFLGSGLGLWTTVSVTGTTKPASGSADEPMMSLSGMAVRNESGGVMDLTVQFEDLDFASSIDPIAFDVSVSGTTGGLYGGIKMWASVYPNYPCAFNRTVESSEYVDLEAPGAFSQDMVIGPRTVPNNYGLCIGGSMSASAPTTLTFDMTLTQRVPEPPIAALLGLGALALGASLKRRRTFA